MTARACAFCGRPADSAEHLWADWVNGYCKPPGPLSHVAGMVGSLVSRQWRSQKFNQRTRYLCHDCNTNWLSDLEMRVSGILGPMMQGQRTRLDSAAQTLVATWIAKTVMMLQYVHAERLLPVPRRHFGELHNQGKNWRPPSNTQVWLAHYTGIQLGARYAMQPLEVESEHYRILRGQHAYAATISVCEFAAQIFGCGVDVDVKFQHPALFQSRIIKIWPVRYSKVDWPPAGLNDVGMNNLAGAFGKIAPVQE